MGQIQKYLDNAVQVLDKFMPGEKQEDSQLAMLLQDVVKVDEPKVLAIAKTLQYMGAFNQLVRDNVGDMTIADRYAGITAMFDSIREDSKKILAQYDDGKIDWKEKLENFWMKLVRGTPHARFEKIVKIYKDVSKDTLEQLTKEDAIMDAYIDFRFALKEAEILALGVMAVQEVNLKSAMDAFRKAVYDYSSFSGDEAEKSRLQLKRDEAERINTEEDKKYQLLKDVAENLKVGYNVGETLVAKLKQTNGVKDRVHKRSIVFFTTNEHVFTVLDAVYTSQHGLNEATKTLEAMTEGANKGLEDVAELGRNLEKAALKAGYGSTLNPESVKKLVDAVVSFQEESHTLIAQYREEATNSAKEIEAIVEDGKKRFENAVYNFSVKPEK
jgi:hypothetical protein